MTWESPLALFHTGVYVMTLNRPDKLNALSVSMGEEFRAHVAHLAALPSTTLRALVLTGAGQAFSAGLAASFSLLYASLLISVLSLCSPRPPYLSPRVLLPVPPSCCDSRGDLDFLTERTKTQADENTEIMLQFYQR